MRRRLFLQVYFTILAVLVTAMVVAGAVWRVAEGSRTEHMVDVATEFLGSALPPPDASAAEQQRALDVLHARLHVDLALYAADGEVIATAGRPMPYLPLHGTGHGIAAMPGRPAWLLQLPDGRWFAARLPTGPWRPGAWLAMFIAALGIAVALGAYPAARNLTRRLERLKAGVEQLGQGDLAARVKVEGKDEIAALAESFNRAATRIEELVTARKMLLANASHELRTPLARITMALELAGGRIDPAQRAHLRTDIGELDQLIGEILLASRLDTMKAPERSEVVDLLALAAEEAARDGIEVSGRSAPLRGDAALLRRMIRNLIDNARRHGGDRAPEITVTRTEGGQAQLDVRDHGTGVPEAERERIFEPFYRIAGSAESGRGSGLGLTLVRQIAANHGGSADCMPVVEGTLFRVMLPGDINGDQRSPALA